MANAPIPFVPMTKTYAEEFVAMCADIVREGAQEMAEQGLAWKALGGAVGKACADWYKGVCS